MNYSTYNHHHSDTAEFMANTMRNWLITANAVGFKPFMGKHGAAYTRTLIRRGVIELPKDAAGVRCLLELNKGAISRGSLELVVNLLP